MSCGINLTKDQQSPDKNYIRCGDCSNFGTNGKCKVLHKAVLPSLVLFYCKEAKRDDEDSCERR